VLPGFLRTIASVPPPGLVTPNPQLSVQSPRTLSRLKRNPENFRTRLYQPPPLPIGLSRSTGPRRITLIHVLRAKPGGLEVALFDAMVRNSRARVENLQRSAVQLMQSSATKLIANCQSGDVACRVPRRTTTGGSLRNRQS